jgi:hypothetical protein
VGRASKLGRPSRINIAGLAPLMKKRFWRSRLGWFITFASRIRLTTLVDFESIAV